MNFIKGCLIVIGGLVIFGCARGTDTPTPPMPIIASTVAPDPPLPDISTVAPQITPPTMVVVTPQPPAIAASSPRQAIYLPSLAVAPTVDANATAIANAQIAVATVEAKAMAATAIAQATATAAIATQEAQQAAATAATNAQRVTAMPDEVWCANNEVRIVCVDDFRYVNKFGIYEASAGTRYVAFLVAVQNMSDSSVSVNPYDVTLVMSNGQTHSHTFGSYSYWDIPLDAVDVAPGDKAMGGVLFQALDGLAPERIIYRGGFWEDDITIDLTAPPTQ